MTYTVSDSRFGFDCKLRLDTYTLEQALIKIEDKEIKHLIIIAEARFKNSHHQNLDGLTLLKHLLVNQKKQFYKTPITFIHATPYKYLLEKDEDNLIILAPNIKCRRWQVTWNENIPDFKNRDCSHVTLSQFKPFVLYSSKDVLLSEHDVRNEIGAEQLKKEWKGDFSFNLRALHFKKQAFLDDTKNRIFLPQNKSDFLKRRKEINKVLILEDEKDKWQEVFETLLPEKHSLLSDYNTTENLLKQKNNDIISLFKKFDADFYPPPEMTNGIPTQSKDYIKKLREVWDYDMVLCDLNFKKDKKAYQGVELIKLIRKFDPYIPIIVFTASKKHSSFEELEKYNTNISGNFVKGVDGLDKLTSLIKKNIPDQRHKELQWRLKLCLYRYYNSATFHYFDYDKSDLLPVDSNRQFYIKLVLESLHNLMKPQRKNEKFKLLIAGHNPDKHDYSRVQANLFSIFLISEIILQYSTKVDYDNLPSWYENSRFYITERKFRGLRNRVYHPTKNQLKFYSDFPEKLFNRILFFLNWLINPLQIEEVRDLLNTKP